jgi:hypothetical protein
MSLRSHPSSKQLHGLQLLLVVVAAAALMAPTPSEALVDNVLTQCKST